MRFISEQATMTQELKSIQGGLWAPGGASFGGHIIGILRILKDTMARRSLTRPQPSLLLVDARDEGARGVMVGRKAFPSPPRAP